ncbi:zinc metalloproteinase nas-1-like [Daphnia pulicaria]|uniref:zinc metalloproteinase nas-1-like n=1 Tax=Daphnia pulicaria TaxID=35523 RepID=UPI001EEB29C2|nr:zinc metalloproteinase nas-1-like [Daphnia pulicaria]XP_046647130.1 zinc metalloproteinase nas-1-like [Daphnia pulicaria]
MRRTIANVWVVWVVVCVHLELVKAKPVSTGEEENSNQTDEFSIGEPLTKEEFASNITVREGEIESQDFIPWDKQDPGLFGGDMKLSGGKTGIVSLKERWPDALIPYTISASYTPRQREIIASAMNALHQNTCIRFVPRASEKDYVRITKTGGGCWSEVGMIGLGRQTLSLDDRCILASIPGLIVHELMHTLGFYHEHQRPDRDEFVSINLKNVEPKNRGYFQKMSEWDFLTLKFSYDYGSVTHYPSNAFAKDSKIPVILKLNSKNPYIANRKAVSPVDVEKLNDWYCGSSDDYLS